MTGNLGFNPDNPLFLLDESLAPSVARALALVGYRFVNIEKAFGVRGVKDPDIIQWCGENFAVWVHADDRARRQHGKQIHASRIRTLWIYRKGGQMTAREQLRILSSVLPRLIDNFNQRPSQRHYRATAANETSNPSLRPVSISS